MLVPLLAWASVSAVGLVRGAVTVVDLPPGECGTRLRFKAFQDLVRDHQSHSAYVGSLGFDLDGAVPCMNPTLSLKVKAAAHTVTVAGSVGDDELDLAVDCRQSETKKGWVVCLTKHALVVDDAVLADVVDDLRLTVTVDRAKRGSASARRLNAHHGRASHHSQGSHGSHPHRPRPEAVATLRCTDPCDEDGDEGPPASLGEGEEFSYVPADDESSSSTLDGPVASVFGVSGRHRHRHRHGDSRRASKLRSGRQGHAVVTDDDDDDDASLSSSSATSSSQLLRRRRRDEADAESSSSATYEEEPRRPARSKHRRSSSLTVDDEDDDEDDEDSRRASRLRSGRQGHTFVNDDDEDY